MDAEHSEFWEELAVPWCQVRWRRWGSTPGMFLWAAFPSDGTGQQHSLYFLSYFIQMLTDKTSNTASGSGITMDKDVLKKGRLSAGSWWQCIFYCNYFFFKFKLLLCIWLPLTVHTVQNIITLFVLSGWWKHECFLVSCFGDKSQLLLEFERAEQGLLTSGPRPSCSYALRQGGWGRLLITCTCIQHRWDAKVIEWGQKRVEARPSNQGCLAHHLWLPLYPELPASTMDHAKSPRVSTSGTEFLK